MSRQNFNRMYVYLKIKPYGYRYLTNHFQIAGEPEGCISLKKSGMLASVFRNMLNYKSRLGDGACEQPSARWRTRCVAIDIGTHNMEHYGLDLTDDAKDEFAYLVERICQDDFRQFFVNMYMVEPRVKNLIEQYQRLRGYTEEDWPWESMQKMVTRMHVTKQLRESREEYLQKFHDFFTANLSALVDNKRNKLILSQLCNLNSTPGEASEEFMQSQSMTSSESDITGLPVT